MYAANAAKGRGKQQALPLKCDAIHQGVLEDLGHQAARWRARFVGNILPALRALDGSCATGTTKKEKALRTRICKIYSKKDAWYRDTCTTAPARKRSRVWPWAGGA